MFKSICGLWVVGEKTMRHRVVFHYNKQHNVDQGVPPWVVKCAGKTHYVHHFTSEIGFSTKETPENEATRASLMVRGVLELFAVGEQLHARVVAPKMAEDHR